MPETLDLVHILFLVEPDLGSSDSGACSFAVLVDYQVQHSVGIIDRAPSVPKLGKRHRPQRQDTNFGLVAIHQLAGNRQRRPDLANWRELSYILFLQRTSKGGCATIGQKRRILVDLLVRVVSVDANVNRHSGSAGTSPGNGPDSGVMFLHRFFLAEHRCQQPNRQRSQANTNYSFSHDLLSLFSFGAPTENIG